MSDKKCLKCHIEMALYNEKILKFSFVPALLKHKIYSSPCSRKNSNFLAGYFVKISLEVNRNPFSYCFYRQNCRMIYILNVCNSSSKLWKKCWSKEIKLFGSSQKKSLEKISQIGRQVVVKTGFSCR